MKNRGESLGVAHGVSSLARVASPLIAGALYDYGHAIPYFAGAGMLLIICLYTNSIAAQQRAALDEQEAQELMNDTNSSNADTSFDESQTISTSEEIQSAGHTI